MVYITGDTHADFTRFSTKNFPEQKDMTREDIVIVLGDFGGVWEQEENEREAYWLKWLNEKPFTLCYVDGNHENFDRYYNDEFPIVDFHGGKAHKIRDNIYHLMRGNVFEFDGKKFFSFGGASSHDIEDGILDPRNFATTNEFVATAKLWAKQNKMFRINHLSWWEQELPSQDEMDFGKKTLENNGYEVNYVISHCLPGEIAAIFSNGVYAQDSLTNYFNEILANGLKFAHWYCGHYHADADIISKYHIRYHKIERII